MAEKSIHYLIEFMINNFIVLIFFIFKKEVLNFLAYATQRLKTTGPYHCHLEFRNYSFDILKNG